MKDIRINFTDSIDNFFFEEDFMSEDEIEYYEDITLPDDAWDDIETVDNKENISWNPNTVMYRSGSSIKEDIPSPDPEDFSLNSLNLRENSEQLVNNFLDLDNPELSSKMKELMKMHDFMKIFIHKITRVPDSVLYNEEEINQSFSIDESIYRKRECSDVVLMKRSYNAFKVLTSSAIIKTVAENAKFIGKELLKIFHSKSEGNFNHFKPLWNHLIEITHGEIALLLTSNDEYKEPPVYQMLRYIHEPAITSSLISSIFLFDAKPGLQVELFTKLQEMEFIETLLAMLDMDMKDFPVIVHATADFLIQLIEEGSKTEDSNILLASIQSDPSCLSILIKHISENKCLVHQQACIQLLLAFLEKCIYTSDNVSLTTSSFVFSDKKPLEPLKESILSYLKYNIDELCMGLTDGRSHDEEEEDDEEEDDDEEDDLHNYHKNFLDEEEEEEEEEEELEEEEIEKVNNTTTHNHDTNTNTIKTSNSHRRLSLCHSSSAPYNKISPYNKKINPRLTVNRIDLLKIISMTIKEFKKEEYDMLENIPWTLLVTWFFQNPSNNIYHTQFFKFFEFALKSNTPSIQRRFFSDTHLIQQFIDNFNIPRYIDCKGYIILMCNHIRFTYESQPNNEFFHSLLEKDKQWEKFLPELKKATKHQIGNHEKFEWIGGTSRPLPYTPKPTTHKYLARLVKKDKELKNMDGVELDSLYAALLGYGVNEDKKNKPVKKNKRNFTKYQPMSSRKSTQNLDLINSEPTLYENYQESTNATTSSTSDAIITTTVTKPIILTTTNGSFNPGLIMNHSSSPYIFNTHHDTKKDLLSYEI